MSTIIRRTAHPDRTLENIIVEKLRISVSQHKYLLCVASCLCLSLILATSSSWNPEGVATISGVTGSIFAGEKIRSYSGPTVSSSLHRSKANTISPKSTRSSFWGVCTTINPIGEAIEAVLDLHGWHVVVVADRKTPHYPERNNMIFLSVSVQLSMRKDFKRFIDLIPWNHFGRKNIGYLYAIIHGAKIIFDFDDDNVLKPSFKSIDSFQKTVRGIHSDTVCNSTVNAYKLMGGPVGEVSSWPRGFPLNLIKSGCDESLQVLNEEQKNKISIYQSLADREPDVDAIYRLTRTVPFNFDANHLETINFPKGAFTPFNAQATFYLYPAFWTILLPITVRRTSLVFLPPEQVQQVLLCMQVHGRVSDIWRSYISQPLLWELNNTIALTPPAVVQNRNAHHFLADFDAEKDLYQKSHALVDYLAKYHATDVVRLPFKSYENLMIDLYERGYIEIHDVELSQEWLRALCSISYAIGEC